MSHTSAIKSIAITSIPALRSCVEELARTGLKISLIEKATPRAFYKEQQGMGEAPYVIKLADSPYDIGVYESATNKGSYELRTDFWGGHINKIVGGKATKPENAQQAQMGKLLQMYGVHATEQLARKNGQQTRRITSPSGKIQIEITGAGI